MQLRRRHRIYASAPRVFGPIFMAESPWRVRDELRAAMPAARARRRFALETVEDTR